MVEGLRRLGHDVLTSLQAGRANQSIPDHQVLAFAIAEKRAVLTFNRRHFARLHQQSAAHAGVVSCTVDADYKALARRIDQAVSGKELDGQFIKIYRQVRQRE